MEISRYLPRRHVHAWAAALVLCSMLLLLAASPAAAQLRAPAADPPGVWLRPVDGAVVRGYEAPSSVYGPGHRGVDFAAPVGTPVRAANDGVVTFAGSVAGTLHVTISHEGGLRTSYSFLTAVSVRAGQMVSRGDVVGTSGGRGPDPGHDGSVLHFGLRVGDRYEDPMVLFRPSDLTKLVHLVPAQDPDESPWSPAAERHDLQTSLQLSVAHRTAAVAVGDGDDSCGSGIPLVGDAVDVACDVGGWLGDRAGEAVDAGLDYLDAATAVASDVIDGLRQPLHDLVAEMHRLAARASSALARTPAGMLALDVVEIGRRFASTIAAPCDDDAPPADGTGGSGHLVMVVAGINSSGLAGTDGPTVGLDVKALGYHVDEGEVRYYSYAADGGAYTAEDTHGPIETAAARLRDQLRAMEREHPGREVDLIGHSQGGVVVDYFLANLYHSIDPSLPPMGNVVTLSSPHDGAPLATAGEKIRATPVGRAIVDVADGVLPIPPPGSPAVQELAAGSSFMEHLWDGGLPDHFDFTSIGISEDIVVPATQIDVPGGTETVVAGHDLNEHSAIVNDPDALRAVRAALEGRPPPCVSLATALRSAVAPVVISRVEDTFGSTAAAALGGIG